MDRMATAAVGDDDPLPRGGVRRDLASSQLRVCSVLARFLSEGVASGDQAREQRWRATRERLLKEMPITEEDGETSMEELDRLTQALYLKHFHEEEEEDPEGVEGEDEQFAVGDAPFPQPAMDTCQEQGEEEEWTNGEMMMPISLINVADFASYSHHEEEGQEVDADQLIVAGDVDSSFVEDSQPMEPNTSFVLDSQPTDEEREFLCHLSDGKTRK